MIKDNTAAKGASGQLEAIAIKSEDLRIGMFVDLNCSWFRHPFVSQSFRIQTEQELAIIRGLGLSSILMFPSRSDLSPSTAQCAAIVPAEPVQCSPDAASVETLPPSIREYRDSLRKADRLFRRSLHESSRSIKDVARGSEEGLKSAKLLINGMTELMTNDAASCAITTLMAATRADDPSALHAINVAILSMMVGRRFQLGPDELGILGLAGLLHDVGEREIPPRLLVKRLTMNRAEQVVYQQHVPLSVDLLKTFPGFPDGATELILQHHERVDGSGYPFRLKAEKLSPSARILMLVDEYDGLINSPEVQNNLSPVDALSKLYATGKTLFSSEIIVALIQTLGVYPPGTIVELNDKAIGLVISMNMGAPTKPMVILYDQATRRGEPTYLDLSETTERSIARKIPARDVPFHIADHLSLHRWVEQFISASAGKLRKQRVA